MSVKMVQNIANKDKENKAQSNQDKAESMQPYDEVNANSAIRKNYLQIENNLASLGINKLSKILEELQFMNAKFRPLFSLRNEPKYKVDPLPLFLSKEEFEFLKRGIEQRVNAFNKFLHDVYNGTQEVVPQDLVKSSPYYFPECENHILPKHISIFMYAPDLIHIGENEFIVFDENIKLPSGLGFAIRANELRSQYLPQILDGIDVLNFTDFGRISESMCKLSYHPHKKTKLAVMLSDGYRSLGYHDNRYLASRLGIQFAEPRDLKLDIDSSVMLKTLEGEKEVDVVFRRVSDPDLYVPGISQSYVNKKVNLLNSLSASIIDDEALYQYLDEIVRVYSGTEPLIPTLETYPVVSRDIRQKLISDIKSYIIRKRESNVWMRLGSELSDEEVKVMSSELTAEPDIYVMQRAIYPSLHRNIDMEHITNTIKGNLRKTKIKEGSTMGRLSLTENGVDVILPTSVLIRPYAFYLDGKIETLPVGLVKCATGSTFGSIFECILKDMLVLK
ncbi:MAG: circularly permuted type 2 ATP-grasp protein [Thermoplasmata archaeon]